MYGLNHMTNNPYFDNSIYCEITPKLSDEPIKTSELYFPTALFWKLGKITYEMEIDATSQAKEETFE